MSTHALLCWENTGWSTKPTEQKENESWIIILGLQGISASSVLYRAHCPSCTALHRCYPGCLMDLQGAPQSSMDFIFVPCFTLHMGNHSHRMHSFILLTDVGIWNSSDYFHKNSEKEIRYFQVVYRNCMWKEWTKEIMWRGNLGRE